jgi:23S rRNA (pseudouridine1915-N3)-methyltransferase
LQIQVLCIGKIKDSYLVSGIAEFEKRLRPYAKVAVTELPEVSIPGNVSCSGEKLVKETEGERLLASVKDGFFVIALEPSAPLVPSEEFAGLFRDAELSGKNLCFVIGGPLGLSGRVLSSADRQISFSRMTFTHTMIRLLLFEQIYRGFRILRNEPYHK